MNLLHKALRIRPLSAEELVRIPSRLQRNVISTTPFTPNQVVIQGEKKQSFTFDHVFGPETTQKEIYDKTVMKLIDQFLEGNNVTVLTFGHTSSGKSYTMGTTEKSTHESKGIIPRSITTLLSCVNSTQYKTRKPFMKVSFVEIYNDESTDLLCEGGDRKLNTSLTGLQEIRVNSAEEVTGLLSLGQLNRRSNAQDLNRHDPDNSHVIVFSPKLNKQFDGEWVTVTSKFHFVDLAGNEMVRSFGLEHKLKEHFTSTNELTTKVAIGNAICALGDPSENSTFLPYKGSKLTRILQNYLCNNIQALIIACVSPIEYNIKETVNTLEYAKHARKIKYTHINHQEDQVEEKEEEEGWNNLEHLQNLVLKLRSEIKALKGALTFSFDNDLESGTISNDQSSLSSSNNEKEIN
ncbi:P-loop containing nucleoside triphosphate hydrolase protein, partial [Rhizophagus irregularis]